MNQPPVTMLFHAVPAPLRGALAEQGVAAPAYHLLAGDAAMLTGVQLALVGPDPVLPDHLRRWRVAGLRAPVLLLGAGGEDWEVTETLPLPVRLGALLTRLRYYLSLAQGQGGSLIRWGAHEIDAAQKILRFGAREQIMTDKEAAIMLLLAESGQPWSRDDLLREIWGYDATIDTHTLETHIYRLRRKLSELGGGGDIVTTPAGYQLSCA